MMKSYTPPHAQSIVAQAEVNLAGSGVRGSQITVLIHVLNRA
jgi:hypothetical protein